MSLDEYERLKVIGKGSYGEVWLAKHKTDKKQYVLKKMDLRKASKKERLAAEQEAKLLSNLRHPNIVAYKDTFEGGDGFLYIAMGYCERGDLYTRLKEQKNIPLEERQVVEWFVQIAMALQYMHERNILHRDLKTQNIFLTKNKIIKVGDLGIARVLDSSSDMATTLIGTPYYMSPELFSNKPYNFKSDVWALGCCVYEMTTLKHAFNAKDMNALMYRVLRGKMPPMPDMYRKELVDLIKAMLNKSPEKRPSVNRILRDPYIKENIAIFLEGTKNTINRRPGSANKKDRPVSGDGSRPRKPKSDAPSLEPLNIGPDVLEPIKEECTPRESVEISGGSIPSRHKSGSKDGSETVENGPGEVKAEKNLKRDEETNSEKKQLISQKSSASAIAEDASKQSADSVATARHRDRRGAKHSKISKKSAVSNAADSAVVPSDKEPEVFTPLEKNGQPNSVFGNSSTSESADMQGHRKSSREDSSNSEGTVKVRSSPSKRRASSSSSSSVSKPLLPKSRSSMTDLNLPPSDAEVPVIKSRSSVSDFRSPITELKPSESDHRISKSEPRSSSSDLKPPVPLPRPSVLASFPPKCDSSPSMSGSSGSSGSKHRSSPSHPQVSESNGALVEKRKPESRQRPLPPRPMSSSINAEQSKAIISKSSKVIHPGGDSGRSSSTSSSGYSGKEEAGDASEDRISESVNRASHETPVPMRSIESGARQRRRLQQQQQLANTPRINSRSVDVSICPTDSFRGSYPLESDRPERKSMICEPAGGHMDQRNSSKDSFDPNQSEQDSRLRLNSSNGSGSSSDLEEDEESRWKAQEKEENKEIDSFINLLGTTLHQQKRSKDSDDEGDSGVEAVLEVPRHFRPTSVCSGTYVIPVPSPLPPGAKYPYIDENSRPMSGRNKVARRKTLEDDPVVEDVSKGYDVLDSAISMTTTGRLFERISLLRKDCIHALGVEKLKLAYDILDCFDTDELEPKLIDLLGQENFDAYAGKIWQLKFCEDSAFRAQ